jgi:hypothetical protein
MLLKLNLKTMVDTSRTMICVFIILKENSTFSEKKCYYFSSTLLYIVSTLV